MKNFIGAWVLAASVLMLAGCSSDFGWPDLGRGGIAEERPQPLYGEAEILNRHLLCQRSEIERFKNSDASKFAQSNQPVADLLVARVARELTGGLVIDARADLVLLAGATKDLLLTAGLQPSKVGLCAP